MRSQPTNLLVASFPILKLTFSAAVADIFAFPTLQWSWPLADFTFMALLQATANCLRYNSKSSSLANILGGVRRAWQKAGGPVGGVGAGLGGGLL